MKKLFIVDMMPFLYKGHFVFLRNPRMTTSGINTSALIGLASGLLAILRKEKPTHIVGLDNAQWVAMDYTDVLVHVFLPDVREYYDLEHLWDDATLTQIPDLD